MINYQDYVLSNKYDYRFISYFLYLVMPIQKKVFVVTMVTVYMAALRLCFGI